MSRTVIEPAFIMMVSCGGSVRVPLDRVRMLSDTVKLPSELQHGDQGIMQAPAIEYDDLQYIRNQHDSSILRQAYATYYSKHGGRQLEKQLNSAFSSRVENTPLSIYRADRFQAVIRKAIELEDNEEQPELMAVCRDVIRDNSTVDADSFIELQRLIMDVNAGLHNPPTVSRIQTAGSRMLKNDAFLKVIIDSMPGGV